MKLHALRTFKPDRKSLVRAGQTFDTPDHKADHYIRHGMAEYAGEAPEPRKTQEAPRRRTQNKPQPAPRSHPSEAAGEAQPSSASRAAPASKRTTAKKSTRGRKPKKATPAE